MNDATFFCFLNKFGDIVDYMLGGIFDFIFDDMSDYMLGDIFDYMLGYLFDYMFDDIFDHMSVGIQASTLDDMLGNR